MQLRHAALPGFCLHCLGDGLAVRLSVLMGLSWCAEESEMMLTACMARVRVGPLEGLWDRRLDEARITVVTES